MVRKKNNSKTPWEENKNNLEDQDNICFCCWIMLLQKKKKNFCFKLFFNVFGLF